MQRTQRLHSERRHDRKQGLSNSATSSIAHSSRSSVHLDSTRCFHVAALFACVSAVRLCSHSHPSSPHPLFGALASQTKEQCCAAARLYRHTPLQPLPPPAPPRHRSATFLLSSRLSTAAAMSKRAASYQDDPKQLSKKARQEVQPDAEKPQCPICMEEWEADEDPSDDVASCVPRMLSCFHSVCTKCMAGILTQASKR